MKSVYSIRRPVTNPYLVRERDRRLRRDLVRFVGLLLPLVAGVLGYVWISHAVLDAGYRLRELDQRLERLAQVERGLQVEASHLARHERIERLAAEQLGMHAARVDEVVFAEELP